MLAGVLIHGSIKTLGNVGPEVYDRIERTSRMKNVKGTALFTFMNKTGQEDADENLLDWGGFPACKKSLMPCTTSATKNKHIQRTDLEYIIYFISFINSKNVKHLMHLSSNRRNIQRS